MATLPIPPFRRTRELVEAGARHRDIAAHNVVHTHPDLDHTNGADIQIFSIRHLTREEARNLGMIMEEAPAPSPPAAAEWLLTLLVRARRAEALLGDLEERYRRDIEARGNRPAWWLYWARALNSLGPLLWSAIKRVGIFAAVADVARRCLGG